MCTVVHSLEARGSLLDEERCAASAATAAGRFLAGLATLGMFLRLLGAAEEAAGAAAAAVEVVEASR